MSVAAHSPAPLYADWRDRYELIGKIGSGGFAEVYEARDRMLDEPVALKVVANGRSMSGRVVREVEAAAALSHPNIVALYDWFGDGERTILVWELVVGASLDKLAGEYRGGGRRRYRRRAAERPRLRAQPGHRPSRREASERHAGRGRSRQDHGLRHRPHARCGHAHRGRGRHRHGGVHVAGAGGGPPRPAAERRVLGRHGALRTARRGEPVARRHPGGDALQRGRRPAPVARRPAPGPAVGADRPHRRRHRAARRRAPHRARAQRGARRAAAQRTPERPPAAAGAAPRAPAAPRRSGRGARRGRRPRGVHLRRRARRASRLSAELDAAAGGGEHGGVGRRAAGRPGLASGRPRLPRVQRLAEPRRGLPGRRRRPVPAGPGAARLGGLAGPGPAARPPVAGAAGGGRGGRPGPRARPADGRLGRRRDVPGPRGPRRALRAAHALPAGGPARRAPRQRRRPPHRGRPPRRRGGQRAVPAADARLGRPGGGDGLRLLPPPPRGPPLGLVGQLRLRVRGLPHRAHRRVGVSRSPWRLSC